MSTYYPPDDRHETEDLKKKILELEKRNRELVAEAVKKSTQLIDAEDRLRRWTVELESLASKKGHGLCHVWIPILLKNTIGHTGNFPDPDKITREEFELGCKIYQDEIFGPKFIIPEDVKNKGILTKEQSDIARKLFEKGLNNEKK